MEARCVRGEPKFGGRGVGRFEFHDFDLRQVREVAQTLAYVRICEVDPLVIEAVGAGLLRRKPESALLGLTHLGIVAFGEERTGQPVHLNLFWPSPNGRYFRFANFLKLPMLLF
jgi:hypothetical protein